MKKLIFITGILFAMQTALMAQLTDTDIVVFNAHLLKTFDLTVVTGAEQDITFAVAADYNNGVTGGAGIAPGSSTITVEATGNWWLSINAPDFTPYIGPNGAGTGIIPINNLGVWVAATGAHQIGVEVTSAYDAAANALGLQNAPAAPTLIGNGTGNAGDVSDNAFTLNWLMGTQNGSMNTTTTMFEQLSAGLFGVGDFTTTATLTLTEIP